MSGIKRLVTVVVELIDEAYKLEAKERKVELGKEVTVRLTGHTYQVATSLVPSSSRPARLAAHLNLYELRLKPCQKSPWFDDYTEGLIVKQVNIELRKHGLDFDPLWAFALNSMTVTFFKP